MIMQHNYQLDITWTGNNGTGTSGYRDYERSYTVSGSNKVTIQSSSDPAFRGDKTKYNPEELLLAALSGCHMLSYLHLCATAGVIVIEYSDNATGVMVQSADGKGRFETVTLHPNVIVSDASMIQRANDFHKKASAFCFIANSVNFSVLHEPQTSAK